MRKRFKTKRRRFFKLKFLLFLGLIYFSCNLTYSSLLKNSDFDIKNEDFLKLLVSESNHNIIFKQKPKQIINKAILLLSNIDLTSPASILGINFFDKSETTTTVASDNHEDVYNPEDLEKITEYIKDPNPILVSNPRVYIYNSHQLENYDAKNLEIYNITPNVMMGSYMLKEKLNNLGIPSIAEEANLIEFMRVNNWSHEDSYKASRIFILDAKNKYDSLEYYIDIHRDSVKKSISTTKINNKDYARTLFVVGLDNPNYQGNLGVANDLNKIINSKYPGLSRGILKKQGAGVNGVYNQDISSKMILLEIGGIDNNIEEVLNTIEAVSVVLFEYINGDSE